MNVENVRKARSLMSANRKDLGIKERIEDGERIRTVRTVGIATTFSHRFGSQWIKFYNLLEEEGNRDIVERIKEMDSEKTYEYLQEREWSNLSRDIEKQADLLLNLARFYYGVLLNQDTTIYSGGNFPLYDYRKGENPEKMGSEDRSLIVEDLINIKSAEISVLKPWPNRFRPIKPEWANEIKKVLNKARERLEELEKIAEMYRIHLSHMWYSSKGQKNYTPKPFAMVSVFVYTRDKDKWERETFEKAIGYVEEQVFTSFRHSAGDDWRSKEVGDAYYEVKGYEEVDIDPEEKPDEYNLDQLRYYVAFYMIKNNIPQIHKEYWGWLESPTGPYHDQSGPKPPTFSDIARNMGVSLY